MIWLIVNKREEALCWFHLLLCPRLGSEIETSFVMGRIGPSCRLFKCVSLKRRSAWKILFTNMFFVPGLISESQSASVTYYLLLLLLLLLPGSPLTSNSSEIYWKIRYCSPPCVPWLLCKHEKYKRVESPPRVFRHQCKRIDISVKVLI